MGIIGKAATKTHLVLINIMNKLCIPTVGEVFVYSVAYYAKSMFVFNDKTFFVYVNGIQK